MNHYQPRTDDMAFILTQVLRAPEQLLALAAPLEKSGYGRYLQKLLSDDGVVFDEV